MQFKQEAKVYTPDGKEVGRVERVVIDPRTRQITHIVIRRGFLLTASNEDKVVPVNLVAAGEKDNITLRIDAQAFSQLPNYQETHYVLVNEEEIARSTDNKLSWFTPTLYWYPPYGESLMTPAVEPPVIAETETHIPKDTIAVKEGAKVITSDDKHIGNVEQVLTSPASNRATHFLVSKGLVVKEHKLIPSEWVESFDENELRLAVGSRTIEELPKHEFA